MRSKRGLALVRVRRAGESFLHLPSGLGKGAPFHLCVCVCQPAIIQDDRFNKRKGKNSFSPFRQGKQPNKNKEKVPVTTTERAGSM